MLEIFKNRKGIDGVYYALFFLGLALGLGAAYAALRFIPGFAGLVGL
tara:strand:+ start:70 stop:210 length:141 start_codon:yes stop_codon:yes gene_type:complete